MKVYLASAENEMAYTKSLNVVKAPHMLMSYFYLRNKNHDTIMHLMERAQKHADFIFLDSGAHTFIANNKQGKTQEDPFKYMDDYFAWLEKYHHFFTVVAELDIAGIAGVTYADVESWRARFAKAGMAGKLAVVGHHIGFTKLGMDWKKEWERLCGIYPYMAIGDQPGLDILKVYFAIWKRVGNNNRIHGFAETKNDKMKGFPFFSVDSTSWNSGSRYGLMLYYEPKEVGIKQVPLQGWNTLAGRKKSHEVFAKYFNKLDEETRKTTTIDVLSEYTKGAYERDAQNARAFIRMAKEVEKIWRKRGIDFEANPPKVNGIPKT